MYIGYFICKNLKISFDDRMKKIEYNLLIWFLFFVSGLFEIMGIDD